MYWLIIPNVRDMAPLIVMAVNRDGASKKAQKEWGWEPGELRWTYRVYGVQDLIEASDMLKSIRCLLDGQDPDAWKRM